MKAQPDNDTAREQVGLSYLRRGDLDSAATEANTILRKRPRSAEGHRLMALVLWHQRDTESALAECAQAVASDPDSMPMAALQMAGLWKLQRKKDAQALLALTYKTERQIIKSEFFCHLTFCDEPDISLVQDFLRRSRWVVLPPPTP